MPLSAEESASTEQEAYPLVAMRGGGEHVFGFDTAGEDQSNRRKGIDFIEGSLSMSRKNSAPEN